VRKRDELQQLQSHSQAAGSRQSCPVRPAIRDLDNVRGRLAMMSVCGIAHAACCVIYHNDDRAALSIAASVPLLQLPLQAITSVAYPNLPSAGLPVHVFFIV